MRDALCRPIEAALANELQKNAPAAGEICQPSTRVIDDVILVLRLTSDQKKFSDIVYKRVDVLFGVYSENSVQ